MIITLRLFVKIMIQGPFNFLDLSEKDDGLDYEMRMVVILLFLMIVMKIYQKMEYFLIGHLQVISDVFTATSSSTN